jgi:hypothetical protein
MRTPALVLTLALLVALGASFPAVAGADSHAPSISRDARGPQPTADHDPLGGPPTPRFYVLGQTTIFAFGVTMLVVAAALGVYTLLLVRRAPVPR